MCYSCGSAAATNRGYARCHAANKPQSNAARLRRKSNRDYRRALKVTILNATGDHKLADRVGTASMSALPGIVAAAGIDPDTVSATSSLPTTGSRNHSIPADDLKLVEEITRRADAGEITITEAASAVDGDTLQREDATVAEVVAKINDPEFQARSSGLRQAWRDQEKVREELDTAAKATIDEAADAMTGAGRVGEEDPDLGYVCNAGAARYLTPADNTEGFVVWAPAEDATETILDDPDARVAAAQALLSGVAKSTGEYATVHGKAPTAVANRIKDLKPGGEELLERYRSGEMSREEARELADRLRSNADELATGIGEVEANGKKPTKKLLGEHEKMCAAADAVQTAVDDTHWAPVAVADIYADPDAIDELYDFDPATLTHPEKMTLEQARRTAAALLLSASNDAADARQDAALDAYTARHVYEAEEDRMAAELVEMIPSGNANSDYKSLGLGGAEMLAVTEEGSADWLNIRNTGIGGSEILPAMGLNSTVRKDGTIGDQNERSRQFWLAEAAAKKAHTFTEDEADHSTTGAAARGHAWEPAMRAAYSDEHPEVEVSCGKQTWKGADGPDSYQTLNVDGIIRNKDTGRAVGLLECKNSDVEFKWENGVPLGYRAQVLSYLDATELDYADLVARVDGEMTTYRIHRDEPLSGVEGTPTFEDYKPRAVEAWRKIQAAKPAIAAAEAEAVAAGLTGGDLAAAVAEANPYSPKIRRPIGQTDKDISTAAANMEGLGLGDKASLNAEIRDRAQDAGSVDAAVRAIIAERFDRARMGRAVGVDGETAAAVESGSGGGFSDPRAFSPLYGDWIETGLVYQDGDGAKSDKVSILHGADERILRANGTGAEDVHHISPEMIAGKPRLTDRETRKQVHRALVDGDVIVAHNVNFEQKHLFHHMPSLKQSSKWLDTAWLARHFMPEKVDGKTRNGKLETFSEDNGVAYRNAHRAAEDADMMIDAMTAFFDRKDWYASPFEDDSRA